jgi:hypothetical protein
MKHLTVAALNDIAQSQLCLYGNKPLFIFGEFDEPITFKLYVGEESILECVNHDETCIDVYGLQAVADRLDKMDENAIINASYGAPFLQGFRVGLKSKEDGFIELFNSTELIQPTRVQ